MFNFFDEIKSGLRDINIAGQYNIVNISGRIVYIEGHKGLSKLGKEHVCLKMSNGSISILGQNLVLRELYDQCIKITGKIQKIEVFDA